MRLGGRSIIECAELEVAELAHWADSLEVEVVAALAEQLNAFAGIGLGYLTLERET